MHYTSLATLPHAEPETRGGLLNGEVRIQSELKQHDIIFSTMQDGGCVCMLGPYTMYFVKIDMSITERLCCRMGTA